MDSQNTFTKAKKEVRDTLANLRKQTWAQQQEAIEALATSTNPLADMVLFHLLDSEDSQVRWAVINALRVDVRPEEKEHVVQTIRTMLQHEENPGLQTDAARIIEEIIGTVARD
ncbi:MAG: hypothetical protein JWL77_3154 [Chthonomonadaceae bacterium]|nr:hypothetical protein [Chthonomonadaceae bacterium]